MEQLSEARAASGLCRAARWQERPQALARSSIVRRPSGAPVSRGVRQRWPRAEAWRAHRSEVEAQEPKSFVAHPAPVEAGGPIQAPVTGPSTLTRLVAR